MPKNRMLKDKNIGTAWKWRHILFWFYLQSQITFIKESEVSAATVGDLINPTVVTMTSTCSCTQVTLDTRTKPIRNRHTNFRSTSHTKLSPWVSLATHQATPRGTSFLCRGDRAERQGMEGYQHKPSLSTSFPCVQQFTYVKLRHVVTMS